jgi:hypothetical protein
MASQRHLELLPVCHHAILDRYGLRGKTDELNKSKMLELAEKNKHLIAQNPDKEFVYIEQVIVDYGIFLDSD